jgi:hypothetical protein
VPVVRLGLFAQDGIDAVAGSSFHLHRYPHLARRQLGGLIIAVDSWHMLCPMPLAAVYGAPGASHAQRGRALNSEPMAQGSTPGSALVRRSI